MNTLSVQAVLDVAAGAPLVVAVGAAIALRKLVKWARRLVIVAGICIAVLLVNHNHVLTGR